MSGIYNVSSALFTPSQFLLGFLHSSFHPTTAVPYPYQPLLFVSSVLGHFICVFYWRYRSFGREIFLPFGFLYSRFRFVALSLGFSHFVVTLVRPVGIGQFELFRLQSVLGAPRLARSRLPFFSR
jgi:hypothetical protein